VNPVPLVLPVLRTERLVLRPLRDDDATSLFAYFSDPVAMRYWSTPPMKDAMEARASIARAREDLALGTALRWGIARAGDDALLGVCSLLHLEPGHRRAEIGYLLGRPHWGHGYMVEALTAVLDHGFARLDLHRVEADLDPRNQASRGLLARLGFVEEGLLRERYRVAGEVSDTLWMGLLRPDWRRLRASGAGTGGAGGPGGRD
jgi:ribosomal-protein-alanine N-acetyltransferase